MFFLLFVFFLYPHDCHDCMFNTPFNSAFLVRVIDLGRAMMHATGGCVFFVMAVPGEVGKNGYLGRWQ